MKKPICISFIPEYDDDGRLIEVYMYFAGEAEEFHIEDFPEETSMRSFFEEAWTYYETADPEIGL